jgi:hypothetical protein
MEVKKFKVIFCVVYYGEQVVDRGTLNRSIYL